MTEPTVDPQVVAMKSSGAQALLIAGTPKFAAQAIRHAAEAGWKATVLITNYLAGYQQGMVPEQILKQCRDDLSRETSSSRQNRCRTLCLRRRCRCPHQHQRQQQYVLDATTAAAMDGDSLGAVR